MECQWHVQELAVVAVNILETGLQANVIALAFLGLAAVMRPPSHNLRAGRLLSTSQTGEYLISRSLQPLRTSSHVSICPLHFQIHSRDGRASTLKPAHCRIRYLSVCESQQTPRYSLCSQRIRRINCRGNSLTMSFVADLIRLLLPHCYIQDARDAR